MPAGRIYSQTSSAHVTQFPIPRFEHITIAQGLPDNNVNCIAQDRMGYLWFGTRNGLARYDGYGMAVFRHTPNDPGSLPPGIISTIFEDREGNLWIGTAYEEGSGLSRFDRTTETFTTYLHDDSDAHSLSAPSVYCVFEDAKGRLWAGTDSGLNMLDRSTNRFARFHYSRGSGLTTEAIGLLSSLNSTGELIGSIRHPGDNEDLSRSVIIREMTRVICVVVGEGTSDEGWLEDAHGNRIVEYLFSRTAHAGGRPMSRIQVDTVTLSPGVYRMRYVSDESYSYGHWDDPPSIPDLWGISLYADHGEGAALATVVRTLPEATTPAYWWEFVLGMVEEKTSGAILVGGLPGIWQIDEVQKQIVRFPLRNPFDITNIKSFLPMPDGTIWMTSSRGLVRYTPPDRTARVYRLVPVNQRYTRENEFRSGLVELGGLLWFGNFDGSLIAFDPVSEQFHVYAGDPNDPASLAGSLHAIRSVFRDRSGVLWVGTEDSGVNKWDPRGDRFRIYSHNPSDPKSLSHNWALSLCEDNEGGLFIGTGGGGLNRFDRRRGIFTQITTEAGRFGTLNEAVITGIARDRVQPSVFWIATRDSGVDRYDRRRNTHTWFRHEGDSRTRLSDNSVTSVLAEDSVVWICTANGGLDRLDKRTGFVTVFGFDSSNAKRGPRTGPSSKGFASPTVCLRDRSGTLWVGTLLGGLYSYHPQTGAFEHFASQATYIGMTCLAESGDGRLWVGTQTQGIFLVERADGRVVQQFSTGDGLASDQVMSILPDTEGNLWIGTYNGLSRLNPSTGIIRSYREEDGVSANSFYFQSAVRMRSGEMFFGSTGGITGFFPDSVRDDPIPPLVTITDVSLLNRPDEPGRIAGFFPGISELALAFDQNDLRLDYVGFHYGRPAANVYRVRLEPFEEQWVDAGSDRTVTYTNLDPGEYTFSVMAANHDGVWNETPASLRIVISPPFWKTWWAFALYATAFIALFLTIRRYELNRANLKHRLRLDEALLREREETDRMKSRFFANISHEFRTPLTLILGPLRKWREHAHEPAETRDLGIAERNAHRLLRLINQLLDLSRLEAGGMKLRTAPMNIVPFVRGIAQSFTSSGGSRDIALVMKVEDEIVEMYADRDKLEKILTNLLSNAFKFASDGGTVTVGLRRCTVNTRPSAEIRVSDTGAGISPHDVERIFDRFYQVDNSQTRRHEGSGIGLALTKELVQLHHGEIHVHSVPGEGTTFTLLFPLGREHLTDDEMVTGSEPSLPFTTDDTNDTLSGDKSAAQEQPAGITPSAVGAGEEAWPVVLLVEDNADVRLYMKECLVRDFRVIEAANGEEGIDTAVEAVPDIVVSDVMMPKKDGFELCRVLKQDERTSHIPVILLTAKAGTDSRIEGLETGADDYLTKPFEEKELIARVRNLIELRRKLRSKFEQGGALKPGDIVVNSIDDQFLRKAIGIVEQHMSDERFSVDDMVNEIGMSRTQLHRKLKALTNLSAGEFIRYLRLQRARDLLEKDAGTVAEIAFRVGFGKPSYFSECFRERFGILPSKVRPSGPLR